MCLKNSEMPPFKLLFLLEIPYMKIYFIKGIINYVLLNDPNLITPATSLSWVDSKREKERKQQWLYQGQSRGDVARETEQEALRVFTWKCWSELYTHRPGTLSTVSKTIQQKWTCSFVFFDNCMIPLKSHKPKC